MINRKYHYLYKITYQKTGEFYIGIHSTDNLNDGYMGSGSKIRNYYKKYGKQNFTKEYIRFFDNRDDASIFEHKIVNEELLNDPLCLNIALGGDIEDEYGITKGQVTVRDIEGNCFNVQIDDPRYISGELTQINKGMVTVRGKDGKCLRISVNDSRYINGEYEIISKGNKSIRGKTIIYKDDEYKIIDKNDLQQYLDDGWEVRSKCRGRVSPTKGLVHLMKGEESIMVNRKDLQQYLDDGWENKRNIRPLVGLICISKNNHNIYISSDELQQYLDDGWIRCGTSRNKGRIYIHKGAIIKGVDKNTIQQYLDDGWKIGRKDKDKLE